jgi:hypothetical protein
MIREKVTNPLGLSLWPCRLGPNVFDVSTAKRDSVNK